MSRYTRAAARGGEAAAPRTYAPALSAPGSWPRALGPAFGPAFSAFPAHVPMSASHAHAPCSGEEGRSRRAARQGQDHEGHRSPDEDVGQASIEHLTIGALDQLLPILQRRCSSAEVASRKATQAAQDASRCTQGAIARCEIVETALNGICDACAEYSCLTSVVRAPGAEVPVEVCRICGAGVEAVRAPPRDRLLLATGSGSGSRNSSRSGSPQGSRNSSRSGSPRGSRHGSGSGRGSGSGSGSGSHHGRVAQAAFIVGLQAGLQASVNPARVSPPRGSSQQVIQQHAHQSARKQHRQQQVQQVQKILSDFGQDQAQRHLNFKKMQRRIYELEDQQQHTQDQQCQLQQLRSNLKKQQKQQEECDQALVQQLSQQRLMYLTTATLPLDDTLYDDEQEFAGMRALDPPRSVRQEQLQRARFERQVMQERLDSAAQLAANAVAVEERARALVDWATARRAQLQADLETAADRRRQQQLAVAQAEMEAVRKRVAQLGGATDKDSGALSTAPRRSEISASQECPVCFQSPRDCGLQCGHQLCMQCADRVQQCPVCRQEISLRLKLDH